MPQWLHSPPRQVQPAKVVAVRPHAAQGRRAGPWATRAVRCDRITAIDDVASPRVAGRIGGAVAAAGSGGWLCVAAWAAATCYDLGPGLPLRPGRPPDMCRMNSPSISSCPSDMPLSMSRADGWAALRGAAGPG